MATISPVVNLSVTDAPRYIWEALVIAGGTADDVDVILFMRD